MKKTRIVLLHYSAFPVIGGVEKVMAHHERLMTADGHPVAIIAGRGDPSDQVILPNLDTAHPGIRSILDALKKGRVPEEFAGIQRRIRESLFPHFEQADVLILHNVLHLHLNLPLTAALHDWMEQRPTCRIISWCHDVSRYLRPSSGETLREGFPWCLLRRPMPGVSYVAVSSARRDLLAQVMGLSPDAIRVIPNGVEPETLLGLSTEGRRIADLLEWSSADVILFLPVRLTQAKNIEFSLRLTAALRDAGIAPRMIVSGPPDPHTAGIRAYIDHLRDLRKRLGLERTARFLFEENSHEGGLQDGVMGELYRLCDIVLMPSHREGFGMPILEAGLVGRAVFATRMPVFETIDPGLLHLIRAGETPQDAARDILAWMETDRRYRLRRDIRRNLTWDAVYRNSIRKLIGRSPRRKEAKG